MTTGPPAHDDRFRLPSRVDTLAALVRGQIQFTVVIALVASWVVPLGRLRATDDDGEVIHLSLLEVVVRAGDLVERLPDETHPFARGWGGWIVVVAAVLVLVSTVAVGWLVMTALDDPSPLARRLVPISAAALMTAAIVLSIGLGWYPEFDDEVLDVVGVEPAWGLWLPVVTALAVLLSHARLDDLSGLGDRR